MTVQTLSTLATGTESSNKLLNSNMKSESENNGLSFNATMSETVSDYNSDEQKFLLSNGQLITADELLEMLKNGNSLPGINLPTISDLQQYRVQTAIEPSKLQAVIDTRFNTKEANFELGNPILNKFSLDQQQFMNQQFNQNQFHKSGALLPDKMLVSFNNLSTINGTTSNSPVTGFNAAYGYQLASGIEGTAAVTSSFLNIATPVQHPQWNQSLGQSVHWMVNNNIQQADIKLNPPELGMLDIRISVNNDNATVTFVAPNSAVRDALESAMPRLRDMLQESGISLADVNVSEHSLEHEQQNSESNESAGIDIELDSDSDSITQDSSSSMSKSSHVGLLDTFA
ncbi:hypothetical protein MNBD_GAMMA22-2132 [hydrothermal vent metagenome]|uniref:Flagellar hook-length control protein-like C-terminal domain-containing protein n=1 Tax=hydrothermal vent metagenome TaxID=652676 RepID=A0A3B1A1Q9_9ZZZZ